MSCASTKSVVTDSVNVSIEVPETSVKDTLPLGNKDIAHESFLRYLYLQHREEPDIALVFLQHAAESDPKNRYLSFTLAEELAEREQYDYALQIAEKAKELPGKPNAAEDGLLASLYLRTGHADSAKVYYKKAIAKNEDDYTKIYEYSLFLEWKNPHDNEELIRVYSMLLPRVRYMRSMFGRAAQLLLENGKDSAFCALLTEAFEATGDKAFMIDKFNYYDGKNRDSSMAVLEKLHESFPEDTTVLKLYGAALIAVNRMADASLMLDSFRVNNEAPPSVIYLQGLSARGENKAEKAKKFFLEVLKNERFAKGAHAQLAFLAMENNDSLTAVREIEIADSLAEGSFFLDRLRMYGNYNMFDKVFPMLDTMLDSLYVKMKEGDKTQESESEMPVKERYLGALALYADLHARYAGKILYTSPDLAEVHYKKASDVLDIYLLNNPGATFAKFLRASILERRHKVDESILAFKEILKDDPENSLAMNYLGYTLIDLSRTEAEVQEGIILVDEALKREPKEVSYLDSKAWGLYRIGKYDDAYKLLLTLPSLRKEILLDTSYWEHLGRILEALGETDKAKECFQKLYTLNPNHPYAKKSD